MYEEEPVLKGLDLLLAGLIFFVCVVGIGLIWLYLA